MTIYTNPYEVLHGEKIVIIFKWQPNVHPAKNRAPLQFLRIQGDPARAIITETIRLVSQTNNP